MLKMVNYGGDRDGQEEHQELEHKERMRKGLKKVMKGKELHICAWIDAHSLATYKIRYARVARQLSSTVPAD